MVTEQQLEHWDNLLGVNKPHDPLLGALGEVCEAEIKFFDIGDEVAGGFWLGELVSTIYVELIGPYTGGWAHVAYLNVSAEVDRINQLHNAGD